MSEQLNDSDAGDARATSFVFGELSAEETKRFEIEMQQSPALQAEVASIREAIAAVHDEFQSASRGVADEARRQVVVAIADASADPPAVADAGEIIASDNSRARRVWIGLAIAASVLLIGMLALPVLRTPQTVGRVEQEQQPTPTAEPNTADSKPQRRPDRFERQFGLEESSVAQEKRPVVTGSDGIPGSPVTGLRLNMPVAAPATPASGAASPYESPVSEVDSPFSEVEAKFRVRGERRESLKQTAQLAEAGEATPVDPFGGPAPVEQQALGANAGGSAEMGVRAVGIAGAGATGGAQQAPNARGMLPTAGQDILSFATEFQSRGDGDVMQTVIDDLGAGVGPQMGGDQHDPITDNPFKRVSQSPLSTFSIDVDTASYSKVRMYLLQHQSLPRPDAVRIEELLNYFTYEYQPPQETDEHPFAARVSIAGCPWNAKHRLARVAIKGKVGDQDRPASNLVFLLDVSGSMDRPNKLPLVVEGMKMLTRQLNENDSVSIVVYAGAAGLVLDSTGGDDQETILAALGRLRAGGSTAGGQGIQLAYETARDNFISGGTNRVILCTDGDFNVGVTGTDQLVRIAEENAKSDIFLSVLGFGMGNHNDAMMEQISNRGNGNYAFIDSKKEAQKVLVEQMGGTLVTIAKDVKVQIEFNPKEVSAYRLIGYENRMLAKEDFNNDKKDAGEIGAGHMVTAMYELVPARGESDVEVPTVDDLRFQKQSQGFTKRADSGEWLLLRMRYKQPTEDVSTIIEVPVKDAGASFSAMDADFKFASSVAAFGMLLRNSPYKGNATYAAVEEIAGDGIGKDKSGRRTEFLEMVRKAKQLSGE